jgi:formylglycine-generating enzyme required for sulfatase activity
MVLAPAGRFTMGSPKYEPERFDSEDEISVTIGRAFAVGRFAVTRGEFAAFVAATGYDTGAGCTAWTGDDWKLQDDKSWRSVGFTQTDRHPAVCVNWYDAEAYAAWLSKTTNKTYRLLSESEREYVTRAGTTTPFWWGLGITPAQANYNGTAEPYRGGGSKGVWRKATVAVDSFEPNPWGLYNVHGNVLEWTEDCWNERNAGNPGDGSARASSDCSFRVLRGGCWIESPGRLRSVYRFRYRPDGRISIGGVRVARTLSPP